MRVFRGRGCSVASLYDPVTGSFQYVFGDDATARAAVIDPVLDYDERSAATFTANADKLQDYVEQTKLRVEWVIDTHPHADHLSAAAHLARRFDAQTATGEKVRDIQALWKGIYGLPDLQPVASFWDRLLADGDVIEIGESRLQAMLCPGHTLASVTLEGGGCAFVHDTLMMPDAGTSRADFPGGSARLLYGSIRRILSLPDETQLFVGHDYLPNGSEIREMATVSAHRSDNIHVRDGADEDAFVQLREGRDATLPLPRLMLAALQVNLRGGRLPDPEPCGRSFLRIPLNYFQPVV